MDRLMYALTIKQPWAWAIIHGGKNVENRSWSTQHRGQLAIHAGRTEDSSGYAVLARHGIVCDPNDLIVGAIIGVVDIVDCVWAGMNAHVDRSVWADRDSWHWVLANPRAIDPILCRGMQGLWQTDMLDDVKMI
jgi:hypothetical protein